MKNKTGIWSIIAGFIALGIFGYLLYLLISSLTKYIHLISPNIAASLIAGLVTVAGYFITRSFERKKIIEQQIRDKKIPVYEEFIDFLFKILTNSKSENPISNDEIEKFMMDFSKKSIIWLSDKSLKSFVKWKNVATNSSGENTAEVLFVLEELFLEIRKDIGHSNNELKKGDLLSLFITDVHNFL